MSKPSENLNIDKTYRLKKPHIFVSQRTNDSRLFNEKNIIFQIEGQRGNSVTVRGKYPNDDFFATLPSEDLVEVSQAPKKDDATTQTQKLKQRVDKLLTRIKEAKK